MRLDYTPDPIVRQFINSKQPGLSAVDAIWGPWGSGKSVGCVIKILKLCMEMPRGTDGYRRSRWAIVRNTRPQLKSTTIKTWDDWITRHNLGFHRTSESVFYLQFNDVRAEILFTPLDTPADEQKVLSLEITGAWFNETREIDPAIFTAVKGRTGRYPSQAQFEVSTQYWYGVIADSNFPDEDSFYNEKLEVEKPSGWRLWKQPGGLIEVITATNNPIHNASTKVPASTPTHFIKNPEAENIHRLPPDYYTQHIGVASKPWIRINLCARYGAATDGRPVYEQSFNKQWHVSPVSLRAERALPLVIGLDCGRTPAAVIKQLQPNGAILTLAELTSQNMSLNTFLDTKLTPFLTNNYRGLRAVVAPDPAAVNPDQYTENTGIKVLTDRKYAVSVPHTNNPDARIACVEAQLSKTLAGMPLYQIDPQCTTLIKGFEGGYRFKQKRNGQYEDKPEKNEYSHPHDANQYADLVCAAHTLYGNVIGDTAAPQVKVATAAGWT